jgi:hypothetical protein
MLGALLALALYLKVEIRDDIFIFLRSPGIISKESIPPAYVA